MTSTPTIRDRSTDPRDRITPHAFSVAPKLLGLPLATHPRRVAALLVDLLLVAVLAAGLGGFFLGVVLAVLFFRLALRSGRNAQAEAPLPSLLFRSSVGCLGGIVLLVTVATVWGGLQTALQLGDSPRVPTPPDSEVVLQPGSFDVFQGIRETREYRAAGSSDEAREAAQDLAVRLRGAGMSEEDVREFLRDVAPERAQWREQIDEWRLLDPGEAPVDPMELIPELDAPAQERLPEDPDAPGTDAGWFPAADTLSAESVAELLEDYASLLRELEAEGEEDAEAVLALRTRIAEVLATDTIQALQSSLKEESRSRLRAERALVALEREETREPGIRAWLRSIAEDLGIGFGWGALYFSVFLTWWNGRTPGKRLFGLRVVRLDGQSISWWTAFERYGGYAAGFATGLIGFAQVYWDPNRQATHDKIAGTAVIMDGREPLGQEGPQG